MLGETVGAESSDGPDFKSSDGTGRATLNFADGLWHPELAHSVSTPRNRNVVNRRQAMVLAALGQNSRTLIIPAEVFGCNKESASRIFWDVPKGLTTMLCIKTDQRERGMRL